MQEPLERKEPQMPPQPAPQKDEAPDAMNQASFGSRREQIGREILTHMESQVSQFESLRLIEAKSDRRELVPLLSSLAFDSTTDKIVAARASGLLVSISRDMTSETIGALRTNLAEEAFLAAYNRTLDPSVRGAAAEIFSNTGNRACADFSLGLLLRDPANPDPHRDNQNFLQGVIRAANAVHEEKTNLYAERMQPALAALLKEPGLSGSNIELIAGGIIAQAIWHKFRAGRELTAQLVALMNDPRRTSETRAKVMGAIGEAGHFSAYPALVGALSKPELIKCSIQEMRKLVETNKPALGVFKTFCMRIVNWANVQAGSWGWYL